MIGFAATVILSSALLWLLGNRDGKRQLLRTAWLLFILLALPRRISIQDGPDHGSPRKASDATCHGEPSVCA